MEDTNMKRDGVEGLDDTFRYLAYVAMVMSSIMRAIAFVSVLLNVWWKYHEQLIKYCVIYYTIKRGL